MSEPVLALEDLAPPIDLRRLADRLLEHTRVEYVDKEVLLVTDPPASEHRAIIRLIIEAILMALASGSTPVRWAMDTENFQWELPADPQRFFVPDITVSRPGAATPQEERDAIELIAEITSPASADTVYNDRVVKPAQYARAGVPLYLLIDQERGAWSLHGLGDTPGYQVLSAGKYGESIPLPAPFGFSLPTAEWPVQA